MADAWKAEVAEALSMAGLEAGAIQDVTTIRFPGIQRATFRVALESGDTIKARRLEDETTARRLVDHRRGLPVAFVPTLGCHGRVVLEPWIDGQLLGNGAATETVVVEAAQLLAALHATPVDGDAARVADTRPWRTDAEAWLTTLAEAGAVDDTMATRLRADLQRRDPGRAAAGLGHFDLCGENMLRDHADRLRVFDNERIGPGPFGFDLARTWYRWDLPTADWQRFERRYAAATRRPAPFADAPFWRLVVLLQSAHLRRRTTPAHRSIPLERLRRLVAASPAQDSAP